MGNNVLDLDAYRSRKVEMGVSNTLLNKKMMLWERENYRDVFEYLAKECGCRVERISCELIDPVQKPGWDPGYCFYGPDNTYLAEIRWRRSDGSCTDFLVYDEEIQHARAYMMELRKRKAMKKSVNQTQEQAKSREIDYSIGLRDIKNFVLSYMKEITLTAACVAMLVVGANSMEAIINPSYTNDSYDSGRYAVSAETHRTQDNQNYWYDYSDIASRFDEERMDFDSYVFGTYETIGWNRESKIDCMDKLFYYFNLQDVTSYDSFVDYCNAKGVCIEKDGKLKVDTGDFRKCMIDYLEEYNKEHGQSLDSGSFKRN